MFQCVSPNFNRLEWSGANLDGTSDMRNECRRPLICDQRNDGGLNAGVTPPTQAKVSANLRAGSQEPLSKRIGRLFGVSTQPRSEHGRRLDLNSLTSARHVEQIAVAFRVQGKAQRRLWNATAQRSGKLWARSNCPMFRKAKGWSVVRALPQRKPSPQSEARTFAQRGALACGHIFGSVGK